MAKKIQAITTYMPRIKRGKMADVNDVSGLIAGRTSLNESGVHEALLELKWVLIHYLKTGQSVRLPGIGLFSPYIKLNGKIIASCRLDGEVDSELNKETGGFKGTVTNNDNVGKTSDELVALWNEEHPDDPVV